LVEVGDTGKMPDPHEYVIDVLARGGYLQQTVL
jgi:hypothetical protein